MDGERRTETLKIGEDVERAQLARLAQVKASRDETRLRSELSALAQAAATGENLIPYMLACVRNYGTVQELSQALVPVFGTYREVSVL
jgi:methylmalonyl-CoA mutase N-terminal domain/subunit